MTTQSQVMRARLHVMRELHAGTRAPGAAISVKETAAALRLSPTPVREALARLAGEGVVTATGERNGFAVPRFSPSGLADVMRLAEVLLDAAIGGAGDISAISGPIPEDDCVRATEATIAWLLQGCHNGQFVLALGRTNIILASYRAVEPLILSDWALDLRRLRDAASAGHWGDVARGYWHMRASRAADLIEFVERAHEAADIYRI